MDFLILFLYIIIIFFVARNIQKYSLLKGLKEYRFFVSGLFLKLGGSIAYTLIYQLHYGYGDTFLYFHSGIAYRDFLFEHPGEWLKLFFSSSESLIKDKYEYISGFTIYKTISGEQPFYYESDVFLMGKIVSLFSFVAFNSQLVISLFFALFSFTGLWKLFQTIISIYPKWQMNLGYAIFYVPSVFFFGSCLMKDSITLGALGWFFYSIFNLLIMRRKGSFKNSIIIIFSTYLLMVLKAYIIICFLVALLIWLAVFYNRRIKNKFIQVILFPILFIIIAFIGGYGIVFIANSTDKYKLEVLKSTAQGYQSYHGSLGHDDGGSSVYSLGEITYTPIGIISKIPEAINVTFFRPYLWEARSFLMIPSALESAILLVLTFYVVFIKVRMRRFAAILIRNEFALLCFIFSLTLGFAVGFTSYNFGALVRYKIPALLFYTIGLSIVYTEFLNNSRRRIKG